MNHDFKKNIDHFFALIEKKLSHVDPDVVECTLAQGNCTLVFEDQSRLILSVQTPVEQLWLAWAKESLAVHFNFDPIKKQWIDDKKKQLDCISLLESILHKNTGLIIPLKEI